MFSNKTRLLLKSQGCDRDLDPFSLCVNVNEELIMLRRGVHATQLAPPPPWPQLAQPPPPYGKFASAQSKRGIDRLGRGGTHSKNPIDVVRVSKVKNVFLRPKVGPSFGRKYNLNKQQPLPNSTRVCSSTSVGIERERERQRETDGAKVSSTPLHSAFHSSIETDINSISNGMEV